MTRAALFTLAVRIGRGEQSSQPHETAIRSRHCHLMIIPEPVLTHVASEGSLGHNSNGMTVPCVANTVPILFVGESLLHHHQGFNSSVLELS